MPRYLVTHTYVVTAHDDQDAARIITHHDMTLLYPEDTAAIRLVNLDIKPIHD